MDGPRPLSEAPEPSLSQREVRPRRRSWRGWFWLGLVLVTVAAAGTYYWYWRLAPAASSPTSARAGAPPAPPVTVSVPLREDVTEWNEFTGQFAAREFVEIRARISGYLEAIDFKDGQLVKKGDRLFVIDQRPYSIALATAQAQLVQTQARLDLANHQLNRAIELRRNENIAAQTYDERLQEVRAATAGVDTAKTAIRSAELDLDYTRITAPVAGRIGQHLVSVGNLITGGNIGQTTLLTTIVSLDPIQFNFDMSEADYLEFQRAKAQGAFKSTPDGRVPVFARLANETGWPHEGTLDFVDNELNRSAGTIRVRAVFANGDFAITPGEFGRLRLPISAPHEALLIPDSAILTGQSRKIVMTAKADGTVEPRVVTPGPIIDGLRVIRDGLGPTDEVIINGLLRARPGGKVSPAPGKIEPSPAP